MINKCKTQMIRKSLYNVKKPTWRGGEEKKNDNTVACKRILMWWSVLINKILSLLGQRSFNHNSFYYCLFVPQFHASHYLTHLNLVLWPILYKIHCIGLFGPGFRAVRAWAPNFVPTEHFVNFYYFFSLSYYYWFFRLLLAIVIDETHKLFDNMSHCDDFFFFVR